MCVLCRGVAIWFAGQSQFSRLHSLGDREQTVVQRRRVFRRALSDARMPRLMPHRGVLYILLVGYIGYRSRSACMVIRYNLTPFASAVAVKRRTPSSRAQTSYRPRERRDDMRPRPPMAVRLAADLRPSADGSAVCAWLSCRQPACL